MTQTRTIRPGLLVSLKTTVTGNVSYRKVDLETAHIDDDGALQASWKTDKTVTDPAEHDEAVKVRGKCRSLITALCAQSDFGLLCRQDNRAELDAAISEAQDRARAFNATSQLTRVTIFAVIGVIAEDDAQATKAINSEVSALLSRMETGVRNLDVEAIRKAANDAREIGKMVTPEASARLKMAIDSARSAARQIVKAGETAAQEVDARAIRAIRESRTAFLDLDDAQEIAAPAVSGRALDLDPSTVETAPAAGFTAPAVTLELF